MDIQSVNMADSSDMLENAVRFFEEIKDPYHFMVDDILVHVEFGGENAHSLQEHINNLLLTS